MQNLKQGATLQGGKYRIEKKLGDGTFGITYLAKTKVTVSGQLGMMDAEVSVAIKEFFMKDLNQRASDGTSVTGTDQKMSKKYRQKFYTEARNLSRLKHPNIVGVLEVFEENNTTYYAMEYVAGMNLNDYIKNHGAFEEKEALNLLREISIALSYMHDNKMLHLDLKPSNVMRTSNGKVVLVDFGLSKHFNDNGKPETSTSIGLGTPGYAPIEQANYIQDGTFPATLDIYALGATLYKMLTGQTPPNASDMLDGFPEVEFAKRNISKETISLLKNTMALSKNKRYQSVNLFMQALNDTAYRTSRTHYNNKRNQALHDDDTVYDKDYIYENGSVDHSDNKSISPTNDNLKLLVDEFISNKQYREAYNMCLAAIKKDECTDYAMKKLEELVPMLKEQSKKDKLRDWIIAIIITIIGFVLTVFASTL